MTTSYERIRSNTNIFSQPIEKIQREEKKVTACVQHAIQKNWADEKIGKISLAHEKYFDAAIVTAGLGIGLCTLGIFNPLFLLAGACVLLGALFLTVHAIQMKRNCLDGYYEAETKIRDRSSENLRNVSTYLNNQNEPLVETRTYTRQDLNEMPLAYTIPHTIPSIPREKDKPYLETVLKFFINKFKFTETERNLLNRFSTYQEIFRECIKGDAGISVQRQALQLHALLKVLSEEGAVLSEEDKEVLQANGLKMVPLKQGNMTHILSMVDKRVIFNVTGELNSVYLETECDQPEMVRTLLARDTSSRTYEIESAADDRSVTVTISREHQFKPLQ